MSDFQLQPEGTIYVLYPRTDIAQQWVDDHIQDYMSWGNGVVVEHRYISDIIQGVVQDGLSVEVI